MRRACIFLMLLTLLHLATEPLWQPVWYLAMGLAGLLPPLSGHVDNVYRNSCGCFIRSEIWACLAPGQPQLAAQYAREDAIVDHSEEGMYAEIFTAALQSAAFVESDPNTLIDIALSYVPADSALARAIAEAEQIVVHPEEVNAEYRRLAALQKTFAPAIRNQLLEIIPMEITDDDITRIRKEVEESSAFKTDDPA